MHLHINCVIKTYFISLTPRVEYSALATLTRGALDRSRGSWSASFHLCRPSIAWDSINSVTSTAQSRSSPGNIYSQANDHPSTPNKTHLHGKNSSKEPFESVTSWISTEIFDRKQIILQTHTDKNIIKIWRIWISKPKPSWISFPFFPLSCYLFV